MPNTVNRGGEGWTADNQAYRAALEAAATRWGGAQAPQLLQVLLNMGRLETNWTGSGSLAGGGWFQISDGLLRDMQSAWATRIDRTNINSAADALAHFIRDVGTGTGLGATYGLPRSDTINLEVGPGMWHGGITGYTRFLTGTTQQSQDGIGPLSTRYTIQALQGAANPDQLSQPLRERYQQIYGPDAWPTAAGNSGIQIGTVGIGSDARHPLFPGGSTLAPEVEQRLQQGYDFLDQWAAHTNPTVASAIEGLSAGPGAYLSGDFPWTQPNVVSREIGEALQYYGYMPSNLRYLQESGTWSPVAAPVSTEGPWGTAALSNWVQDNTTNPNVSEGQRWYVQQIGGSSAPPGGLETWDASPWGTSGNAATNWTLGLGQAGEGGALGTFSPGSGGGATTANVATAGIDLGNWLGDWASRYFGSTPEQVQAAVYDPTRPTEFWDATPGVNVLGRPFSDSPNVYDASNQPAGDSTDGGGNQPIHVWTGDVTNWVPAGGTWGTPWLIGPLTGFNEQQNDFWYNPFEGNWGTPGNGVNVNAGSGSWSPYSGYTGSYVGDFPENQFSAQPISDAGGGGANMPIDDYGRVQQNTISAAPGWFVPNQGGIGGTWSYTMPSSEAFQPITYYNSGIGPGGTPIAPGYNTTPIMTYGTGPGGQPLALGFY